MKWYRNLVLGIALTLALAMAIPMDHAEHEDHDNDHDEIVATPTTVSTASISPTPHVMKHQHGVPILQTHLKPAEKLWWDNYSTQTFLDSELVVYLYIHIFVGLFTFVILYPVSMVLKNVDSRWYLGLLSVHSLMVMVSTLGFWMYDEEDKYPGNVYNKFLVVLFVSSIGQYVATCLHWQQKQPYIPLQNTDVELEMFDSSTSSSLELNEAHWKTLERKSKIFDIFQQPLWQNMANRGKFVTKITYNLTNWINFTLFLILVPLGVAIFGEFGKGKSLFNLLAHFIKGGIFVIYGMVTLARYCGAFADKGWSWNHKFITKNGDSYWQTHGTITMEFVESFLIFFYGSTNVFLERLASFGAPWNAKDLQHASLAFIFIGCGMGGLICEYKLNDWRFEKGVDNLKKQAREARDAREAGEDTSTLDTKTALPGASTILKCSPGFSPNPFPTITIFWTGILMSKHQQASDLSTEIHTLWGTLFMVACAFRLLFGHVGLDSQIIDFTQCTIYGNHHRICVTIGRIDVYGVDGSLSFVV